MDLISAAAEQNRDEALARAMHDTKSMQACRTKVNLPSAEKCEVDINRARSDMSLSDVMTDSVRAAAPAQIFHPPRPAPRPYQRHRPRGDAPSPACALRPDSQVGLADFFYEYINTLPGGR